MEALGLVSDSVDADPRDDKAEKSSRKITLGRLVLLIFFCTSGGPYGAERAVSSAPPLVIITLFLCLPWLWCLPIALATAELSTAFPDEGGGMIEWVLHAGGPKWSLRAGIWYWASCATDNSMYAILFPHYLAELLGMELTLLWKLAFGWGMLTFISAINLNGIDVVGMFSVVFAVLVLAPLGLLVLFCFPSADPSIWVSTAGTIEWNVVLAIVVWQFSGFDDVGSISQHVADPKVTYPRAMLITIGLVILVNLLPIMFTMCADPDFARWREGYLAVIGDQVGGRGLGLIVALGSVVALFSNLNVLLMVTGRALLYMAKNRWLPFSASLAEEGQGHTPGFAILVSAALSGTLLFFEFEEVAELHTVLYCIVISIELLTFIYLRIQQPDLPRPYRMPGGLYACVGLALCPICVATVNFVVCTLRTKCVVAVLFGLSLYLSRSLDPRPPATPLSAAAAGPVGEPPSLLVGSVGSTAASAAATSNSAKSLDVLA